MLLLHEHPKTVQAINACISGGAHFHVNDHIVKKVSKYSRMSCPEPKGNIYSQNTLTEQTLFMVKHSTGNTFLYRVTLKNDHDFRIRKQRC